jgi:nicotinamidase-related amidase
MRKVIQSFVIGAIAITISSCEVLEGAAENISIDNVPGEQTSNNLTNQDVIAGLKEALTIGIKNAVDVTSLTDGFLANNEIKLPFPESANKMKEKALEWGLDGQVDKIVTTLNRAAEDAAKAAAPIFIEAIKNMTVQDGFAILRGGEGAATNFLRKNTTNELIVVFAPKVQNSIEEVKLTQYWEPVSTRYNQAMTFTGGEKVDTDLNKYVTERAIDGLFTMVEKEENKIRKDPAARVTDLLSRVFGSK